MKRVTPTWPPHDIAAWLREVGVGTHEAWPAYDGAYYLTGQWGMLIDRSAQRLPLRLFKEYIVRSLSDMLATWEDK